MATARKKGNGANQGQADGNAAGADQVRVRMYRVGFGDCFLITLPGDGGRERHILVDCGVHARGDVGTMPRVVADIRAQTRDDIDLVVVTHAHQDHISGFGTCASDFAQIRVREVWMPWTENPQDAQANALRSKQLQLALQLRQHLLATKGMSVATDDILENLVGFNLASNASSMRVARGGFKGSQLVRYLDAGKSVTDAAGIPGFDVKVLGPPRDEDSLKRMDPPAGQRWLSANGAPQLNGQQITLFPESRRTRTQMLKRAGNCVLQKQDEAKLRTLAQPDDSLALTLDSIMNNTSLVLLLRYRGASLLFPGDAQWGNWAAWLAKEGADSLLGEVCFYKVGHHGSHNATPKSIVGKMSHPDLAAMISTQNSPWPSIPMSTLVKSLGTQSHKRTVRSDWVQVDGAATARGPKSLPKPFTKGAFWIDYVRKV
jgi:beta-lactamase superfamily II metal-dependent hydrolase